jgi:hypothetical protein
MRIQCQQTYPQYRRCYKPTHGDEQWCRWHKILHEFRDDDKKVGRWSAQDHMFSAGIYFTIGAACLRSFATVPNLIWLPFICFALGRGLMSFTHGVIAQDYPLSQFAFWAKLLTAAMIVGIAGGVTSALCVTIWPQTAQPVLLALNNNPLWLTFGPTLLVGILAFSTTSLLSSFLRLIFSRKIPHLEEVLWFLAFGLVATVIQPVLDRFNPISVGNSIQFWQPALGNNNWWPLAIAYFVAFIACEIINVQMRRRNLDADGFKKTFLISYSVCTLPPTLAMFASRYLLAWTGLIGAIPFVVLTISVSIPLCFIGTSWVIRSAAPSDTSQRAAW